MNIVRLYIFLQYINIHILAYILFGLLATGRRLALFERHDCCLFVVVVAATKRAEKREIRRSLGGVVLKFGRDLVDSAAANSCRLHHHECLLRSLIPSHWQASNK